MIITDLSNFVNTDKIGTIILSYYRSGSHFLYDIIHDSINNTHLLGEINTLDNITKQRKTDQYKLGILNSMHPKFFLLNNNLLNDWHIIHLTQKDKIKHFISTYFWKLNQQDNYKEFLHHGTDHKFYKLYMDSYIRTKYDIADIKVWLLEQLLSYSIPYDYTIDYSELSKLESINISWQNNNYNNISLSSLFTNHLEIKELLENFKP